MAEVLYWMACWIAVTVAIMAIAALATGGHQAWLSVAAYFATAAIIWLICRIGYSLAGGNRKHRKREW